MKTGQDIFHELNTLYGKLSDLDPGSDLFSEIVCKISELERIKYVEMETDKDEPD